MQYNHSHFVAPKTPKSIPESEQECVHSTDLLQRFILRFSSCKLLHTFFADSCYFSSISFHFPSSASKLITLIWKDFCALIDFETLPAVLFVLPLLQILSVWKVNSKETEYQLQTLHQWTRSGLHPEDIAKE